MEIGWKCFRTDGRSARARAQGEHTFTTGAVYSECWGGTPLAWTEVQQNLLLCKGVNASMTVLCCRVSLPDVGLLLTTYRNLSSDTLGKVRGRFRRRATKQHHKHTIMQHSYIKTAVAGEKIKLQVQPLIAHTSVAIYSNFIVTKL